LDGLDVGAAAFDAAEHLQQDDDAIAAFHAFIDADLIGELGMDDADGVADFQLVFGGQAHEATAFEGFDAGQFAFGDGCGMVTGEQDLGDADRICNGIPAIDDADEDVAWEQWHDAADGAVADVVGGFDFGQVGFEACAIEPLGGGGFALCFGLSNGPISGQCLDLAA